MLAAQSAIRASPLSKQAAVAAAGSRVCTTVGRVCLLNPSTTSSLVHSRAVPRNAKAVMHDAAAHDGGSRVDHRWTSGYVDGPVRVSDGADVVGSRQGRCNALYRLLMLVCRIEGSNM